MNGGEQKFQEKYMTRHPELARHGEAKGVAWFQDLFVNVIQITNKNYRYLFLQKWGNFLYENFLRLYPQ
jgi:hypothetical protein